MKCFSESTDSVITFGGAVNQDGELNSTDMFSAIFSVQVERQDNQFSGRRLTTGLHFAKVGKPIYQGHFFKKEMR